MVCHWLHQILNKQISVKSCSFHILAVCSGMGASSTGVSKAKESQRANTANYYNKC